MTAKRPQHQILIVPHTRKTYSSSDFKTDGKIRQEYALLVEGVGVATLHHLYSLVVEGRQPLTQDGMALLGTTLYH